MQIGVKAIGSVFGMIKIPEAVPRPCQLVSAAAAVYVIDRQSVCFVRLAKYSVHRFDLGNFLAFFNRQGASEIQTLGFCACRPSILNPDDIHYLESMPSIMMRMCDVRVCDLADDPPLLGCPTKV
jgi:hypothetical protein